MRISDQNIVEAINQQYRHQPDYDELTKDFVSARMAQVKEILELAEKYEGFQSSEVLFIAYLATQRQINEESK